MRVWGCFRLLTNTLTHPACSETVNIYNSTTSLDVFFRWSFILRNVVVFRRGFDDGHEPRLRPRERRTKHRECEKNTRSRTRRLTLFLRRPNYRSAWKQDSKRCFPKRDSAKRDTLSLRCRQCRWDLARDKNGKRSWRSRRKTTCTYKWFHWRDECSVRWIDKSKGKISEAIEMINITDVKITKKFVFVSSDV